MTRHFIYHIVRNEFFFFVFFIFFSRLLIFIFFLLLRLLLLSRLLPLALLSSIFILLFSFLPLPLLLPSTIFSQVIQDFTHIHKHTHTHTHTHTNTNTCSLIHSLIHFSHLFPGCTGFKAKDNGLIKIHVDTLGPWIFINLGGSKTGQHYLFIYLFP